MTVTDRIAEALRAGIDGGEYEPGSLLPSERVLQEIHGVSRGTVRNAIDILRQEGLVLSRQGHGVVVRTREDPPRITLKAATYDHAFNVPLTLAQIRDLAVGKTLLLEFGPDTELQLGRDDPQGLNIAVILRPTPKGDH